MKAITCRIRIFVISALLLFSSSIIADTAVLSQLELVDFEAMGLAAEVGEYRDLRIE